MKKSHLKCGQTLCQGQSIFTDVLKISILTLKQLGIFCADF